MKEETAGQFLAPAQGFSPAAGRALLMLQCQRYTGGEVSALPAETVAELLRSALFLVRLGCEGEDLSAAGTAQLDALLKKGQKKLKARLRSLKALCRAVQSTLPAAASVPEIETLASIGAALRLADSRLLVLTTEASIDYQLCVPVDDRLPGPIYLGEYLEQMFAENQIRNAFPAAALAARLEQFDPFWQEEISNLCRPAVETAVCLTLLGAQSDRLILSEEELAALAARLSGLSDDTLAGALDAAAQMLSQSLGLTGERAQKTVEFAARELAARLKPALRTGRLEQVFCAGGKSRTFQGSLFDV